MLGKPDIGWSDIKIGEFNSRISYLTDVPFDCLNASISALKYNIPVAIKFDAEGWEFTVVSTYDNTSIIIDDENGEMKLITADISKIDFIKNIVYDIESNIDEWSIWDIYHQCEYEKNKVLLMERIEKIKILLNKK